MGRRLARLAGRPVLCSCGIPPSQPDDLVLAERRVAEELRGMGAGPGRAGAGG